MQQFLLSTSSTNDYMQLHPNPEYKVSLPGGECASQTDPVAFARSEVERVVHPLRTLEAITADILAVEKEYGGLSDGPRKVGAG